MQTSFEAALAAAEKHYNRWEQFVTHAWAIRTIGCFVAEQVMAKPASGPDLFQSQKKPES